jgi:Cytochrome C oxidase, cbb3-type, subunit III
MGNISKTVQVYSNDPSRPVTTLTVRMYVKDAVHMKEYRPREIFNSPCSGCHVERGRSKRGRELFISDCVMCHSEHMSASPVKAMKGIKRSSLVDAVRNGVRGTTMPGWYNGKGGPLGDEEISSLVDFLSDPGTR